MPYCRECGIEVDSNTTYCPECGEELNFGTPEPVEETPEKETTAQESEPIEPESEPETEPRTKPTSSAVSESSGLSIWAKFGVVICIPLALAGAFLEVASVYTLAIGEYTFGDFIFVSVIFGSMFIIPSAYLYWIYTQINMSVTDIF